MNRTTTVRGALLTGATIAILLVAAGCGATTMDHDRMGPAGAGATAAASASPHNDTDVMFAQMMIPHHQQAVEMADLAPDQAQDPQLKQLAASIKIAQQPEIVTMTGWLAAWGQPTMASGTMGHGAHGGMAGMASTQELAQLAAASGISFDRLFARLMIAHHLGAIQMAQQEETDGSHPDAKAMARAILKSQAAEVVTLQQISDRL